MGSRKKNKPLLASRMERLCERLDCQPVFLICCSKDPDNKRPVLIGGEHMTNGDVKELLEYYLSVQEHSDKYFINDYFETRNDDR